MTTTLTDLGVAARDLVSIETYGGPAATTADGHPLLALVQLSTHTRSDGAHYATVDHSTVRSYVSLDVSWSVLGPHPWPADGHARDTLLRGAVPLLASPTWVGLVQLWSQHANTHLSPGCDHQTDDPTVSVRTLLRRNRPCPRDGWEFGSGWLRRPLHADVERRARQVGLALEGAGR